MRAAWLPVFALAVGFLSGSGARLSLGTGNAAICASFGGGCPDPCTIIVVVDGPIDSCYNWQGGWCYGLCHKYFCRTDTTTCGGLRHFFEAKGNSPGATCNGDVTVACTLSGC